MSQLAYKPIITRLIEQMRSRSANGWITVDGLNVLVEQGIAQFEIFTGKPAPVRVMRQAVRDQYSRIMADLGS
jgi:shikimate 5-dehydrogenase